MDREAPVEGVEPHVRQPREEERPEGDDRGERAADRAQPGQPERAEDQHVAQQHLQDEAPELHGHHDVRPRHRGIERVDGPEHERGGQGQAQHAQVPRHERRDLGWGMKPGQPDVRKCKQKNAPTREHERHPQALAIAGADGRVTARAEVLGDDGIERADRAHEADEHRGVDAQPQPQRGEIDRRGVAGEHGVDDREGHHRDLADEDGPRLGDDAPCDRRAFCSSLPQPTRTCFTTRRCRPHAPGRTT